MASENSQPARQSSGANGAERAAKRERSGVLSERSEGTAAQRRPRAPRKVHWSVEQAIVGLTLLGGLPAALALAWIVWGQSYSFEVRWTLAAVVLAVWIGCAAASHGIVTRVLYLSANLLG